MATLTVVRPLEATLNFLKSAFVTEKLYESDDIYPQSVESIRQQEYPLLQDTTYLDHTGTTLYAKSLIHLFSADLTSNIFGNPHSGSASSQLSSTRVEATRLAVLNFCQADPKDFDVVFVANTTAAIKLVADAFRDQDENFWYGYHRDSHTSIVGVRELTCHGAVPFCDDDDVEKWIANLYVQQSTDKSLALFAYPGQSNMTGRCLPYSWCQRTREAAASTGRQLYTLYDAAAVASTFPLNFSNADAAPDFTVLSFYKIFGFPDLGALIVRKDSGYILQRRKYFGGGTVDMVSACNGDVWHARKPTLHDGLEDGTLPFHNIIALNHAIKVHQQLYGSMANISRHVGMLRTELYDRLSSLTHHNGQPVCKIHGQKSSPGALYGPIIAFNLIDADGKYVSNHEVEKLAVVKNIQLRTGGFCNPGGTARYLDLSAEELKANYAAGYRCGGENDIVNGKPFGAIRVSLGAMSSRSDIVNLIQFLEEFYVTKVLQSTPATSDKLVDASRFWIESMSVFPIKSCSAFQVPANIDWEVSAKGLAWDREWCLVHQGTNAALSQKKYPQMALIKPEIDLKTRTMSITFDDGLKKSSIDINLDDYPSVVTSLRTCGQFKQSQSIVCGESVPVHTYTLPKVTNFFTDALGVPCCLARYFSSETNIRYAQLRKPRSSTSQSAEKTLRAPTIKLSNESPILLVSRSSVNRLNQQIQQHRSQPKTILPESFRANIVVAERIERKEAEAPYAEDYWKYIKIAPGRSSTSFDVLGPCRRCQMVCVDQKSAERRQEPYSTLAKTRRWDGGVWFGVHLCLAQDEADDSISTLRIGDPILPS